MKENPIYQEIIDFTKNNDNFFLTCDENTYMPGYEISDSISGKKWEVKILGSGVIPKFLRDSLRVWNSGKTVMSSFVSCLNHKHGFSKESAEKCGSCTIQEIMNA